MTTHDHVYAYPYICFAGVTGCIFHLRSQAELSASPAGAQTVCFPRDGCASARSALCQKHAVELAIVDKTGVHFRFLSPGYGEYHFVMREHGFQNLTPAQQSAMRTVLEERLPHLTEKTHYRLSRRAIQLPNGQTEYSYSYIMSNQYKEMLTRAPYYVPQMVPYVGY